MKEQSDSTEIKLNLLKAPWNPDKDTLLSVVPPHGLSLERQWYLYEQIQPFCPEEDQDSVCPLPSAPKPGSQQNTPAPEPDDPEEEAGARPPPKRQRLCGVCHEARHNKRSCPKK